MTSDDTAARGRPRRAGSRPGGPTPDKAAVHAAWDALATAHRTPRPGAAPDAETEPGTDPATPTGPAGAIPEPSGLPDRPAPLTALKPMALQTSTPQPAPPGDEDPDLTLRAQRRLVENPINRDPRDIVIGPLPPTEIATGRPDLDPDRTPPSAQDADPRRWGAVVVAHALRSVGGQKSPAQLHRWLAADVYGALVRRTETARRLRRGRPDPIGRLRVCSVTLCRPTPRAAELALVIRQGQAVHAATLRLDWRRRWVVTAMDLTIGRTHGRPPTRPRGHERAATAPAAR